MRSCKWFIILLILIPFVGNAQDACGIFASRQDFLDNKLTYTFDECEMRKRVDKDIVATHKGEKLRFDFRFIYGYYDGHDLYRAYGVKNLWTDHGYYKVIYDNDLVIYKRTLVDYRSNTRTHYYFSASKDSPIFPLRKRFYDHSPEVKANLRSYFLSLNESEVFNSLAVRELLIPDAGTEMEKKKPDISARLQTTTRRPKIFNVR